MAQLVKTMAGLAIASVKTVNGLAIASVKTVAGLDNTSGGGGGTIGPISVAANGDDASIYFFDGNWTFDNSSEIVMGEITASLCWGFFRFTLPSAIPDNATIAAGTKLEVFGTSTSGWTQGTDILHIYATDSADAPQPTTAGERPSASGGSTTLTSASDRWPAAGGLTWNTSGWNEQAVIAAIQELVDDNNGLASGAHICLWVSDFSVAPSANAVVGGEAFEAAGTNPAKLTIVYT